MDCLQRLHSLDIGPVRIDDPVILAPMSGVTDMPFRQMVKRGGAGLVVSEMIASAAMVRENRKTLLMAKNSPEEFPMSVQLAGCEPTVMSAKAFPLRFYSGRCTGLPLFHSQAVARALRFLAASFTASMTSG